MSVTETDFGNIRDAESYDVMPIASLIAAAEDAVLEGAENAALVRELVWRVKNEDNRDHTALGSYYRFPEGEEKQ